MTPRVAAFRDRLNQSFVDVNHGEYFRSRIHGWAAYRADSDVALPGGVSERLTTTFMFDRDDDAEHIATLDAFVIAYHAAETYWRYIIALCDGGGPRGAPAIAMHELRTGPEFNDRVSKIAGLSNTHLDELINYVFLPPEFTDEWPSQPPSVDEVRTYLSVWCRELGRFVKEWRNAYNAAKHGLAVDSRPTQLTAVVGSDPPTGKVDLFNGPTLRTLETEPILDENGKTRKGADKKPLKSWFWVYRAIDPEQFIAQAIITADLLDWLRAIAKARMLQAVPVRILVRSEPRPLDLRRPGAPGRVIRFPLEAEPLPPEAAAEVMRAAGLDEEDLDAPEA